MKFYRYEQVISVSMGDNDYGGSIVYPYSRLVLREYNLYKETPKGYWIGYGFIGEWKSEASWVSKTSKKRFAYPTKEEALINYIKRTERRKSILQKQIGNCINGLNDANTLLKNERIQTT